MNNIVLDDLNRASVLIMMFFIIVLSYSHNLSLLFFIKYILNIQINQFFKYLVFKPIMGDKVYPIIGTGTRPPGAMNCGNFREDFFNITIIPKLAVSYGFPSGHSQASGFFGTFIYENFKNNPYIFYPFILYSLYVSYTRVQLGCHTFQQVVVGYTFGIIFYYIIEYSFKNMNYIFSYFKNKNKINKNNTISNKSLINNKVKYIIN